MASQPISPRRTQTDHPQHTSSPLRHGSTASTSSSIYSLSSNSQAPSRTSTISSNASMGSAPRIGHRRGKSELNSITLERWRKTPLEGKAGRARRRHMKMFGVPYDHFPRLQMRTLRRAKHPYIDIQEVKPSIIHIIGRKTAPELPIHAIHTVWRPAD